MKKYFVPGSRQADKPWSVEGPRGLETIRADVLQNLKDRQLDLSVRKRNLELELETINDALAEIDEHIKFAEGRYNLTKNESEKSEKEEGWF